MTEHGPYLTDQRPTAAPVPVWLVVLAVVIMVELWLVLAGEVWLLLLYRHSLFGGSP